MKTLKSIPFFIIIAVLFLSSLSLKASILKYNKKDGTMNKFTRCYAIDDEKRIWVATFGSGIRVFNGKSWHVYTTKNTKTEEGKKEGLISDYVTSLTVDSIHGWLWAITSGGICRMSMKTGLWTHFKGKEGPPVEYVRDVAINDQGVAFFASYAGVITWQPEKGWKKYTPKDGLFDENIRHIRSANGEIWSASRAGAICRYDRDSDRWITYIDY